MPLAAQRGCSFSGQNAASIFILLVSYVNWGYTKCIDLKRFNYTKNSVQYAIKSVH